MYAELIIQCIRNLPTSETSTTLFALKETTALIFNLLTTIAKLLGPGGAQPKKLCCGGPRGNTEEPKATPSSFDCSCARIFLLTTGSSIQAITRTWPPQLAQLSMSMLNTRLSRCAQRIAWRRCAGVLSTHAVPNGYSALLMCIADTQPCPANQETGDRPYHHLQHFTHRIAIVSQQQS